MKRALCYAPLLVALLLLLPGEAVLTLEGIGLPIPESAQQFFQQARLGSRDFWGDEIGTVLAAQEPFRRVISGEALDFHPPLYYLLIHFWMKVFGTSEAAVRVPSVLFGLLLVGIVAHMARDIGGPRVAQWGALLGACYPVLVMFSRMARYYSMVGALAALSSLLFWRVLRRRSPAYLAAYVAVGLALAYTSYLALCLLAAQVLVGIVWGGRRRLWLAACLLLAVGYVPWLGVAFSQAGSLAGRGEVATAVSGIVGAASRAMYPLYVFAVGETLYPWRFFLTLPGLALVGGIATAGFAQSREDSVGAGTIAAVGFGLSVLIASTVARAVPPVYLPSRMLFLAPVLVLLFALGIKRLKRWGLPAGVAILLVWCYSISNYYRGSDFHNPVYLVPWRQIVEELRASLEPSDVVVATPEYPFLFYKGDDIEVLLLHGDSAERVRHRLVEMDCPRLWVLTRERADPLIVSATGPFWHWLSVRYRRVHTLNYLAEDPRSVRLKRVLLRRPVNATSLSLALFVKRPT